MQQRGIFTEKLNVYFLFEYSEKEEKKSLYLHDDSHSLVCCFKRKIRTFSLTLK